MWSSALTMAIGCRKGWVNIGVQVQAAERWDAGEVSPTERWDKGGECKGEIEKRSQEWGGNGEMGEPERHRETARCTSERQGYLTLLQYALSRSKHRWNHWSSDFTKTTILTLWKDVLKGTVLPNPLMAGDKAGKLHHAKFSADLFGQTFRRSPVHVHFWCR